MTKAKIEEMSRKEVRADRNKTRLTPKDEREVDPEKAARYARYNERKHIVYEAEKRNKQYLMLFLASDGELDANGKAGPHDEENFYIMGGASALVYAYKIAPKIGRQAKIKEDMDPSTLKFHSGICMVKGLSKFEKALGGIGIKREETKTGDEIAYFKLDFKFTNKEVNEYAKNLKSMEKRANELLYVSGMDAQLHTLMIRMRLSIVRKLKDTKAEYRQMLQKPMVDLLFEMRENYILMTRGMLELPKAMVRIRIILDKIADQIALMQELGLWDVLFCIAMGENIAKMQTRIDAAIKNHEEKKKKVGKETENETDAKER